MVMWAHWDTADYEIYYSTWDGNAWSSTAATTDNFVEDGLSSVSCP